MASTRNGAIACTKSGPNCSIIDRNVKWHTFTTFAHLSCSAVSPVALSTVLKSLGSPTPAPMRSRTAPVCVAVGLAECESGEPELRVLLGREGACAAHLGRDCGSDSLEERKAHERRDAARQNARRSAACGLNRREAAWRLSRQSHRMIRRMRRATPFSVFYGRSPGRILRDLFCRLSRHPFNAECHFASG
jgi:uncharacterized protein YceH (UPF0502 family)